MMTAPTHRTYTKQEASAIALAITLTFRIKLQECGRLPPPIIDRQTATILARRVETLATKLGQRDLHLSSSTRDDVQHWIVRQIKATDGEILRYEDRHLRDLALDLIPFDDLNAQACTVESEQSLSYQDALVQVLVGWAKKDFLKWVDPVLCSKCSSKTAAVPGGIPTQEDLSYGAHRIELYQCTNSSEECYGRIERFPRYNDLSKLLQTRKGRCGEFAAVFMLLLRALSIRARYVWNSEDHVWNEYYSDAQQRWVHVDSCEGARDRNLLYDRGWGKAMKYCIAVGIDGATDVTRCYVSDWATVKDNRDPSVDGALEATLNDITVRRRRLAGPESIHRLAKEDELEAAWLENSLEREKIAQQQSLAGRTSGTKEWRSSRRELGTSSPRPKPMKVLRPIASSRKDRATLNGSAELEPTSGEVLLTRDVADQTGSAFLTLPAELKNYIIEFSFSISRKGDDGADGMAFTLHADPAGAKALGNGGCELGYGGIKNCLAVEIDTYRSQDRCEDPPTPHIAALTRGADSNSAHHRHSIWCTQPGSLPDIDDGATYHLRVEIADADLRIFFTDAGLGDWVELTDQTIRLPSAVQTTPRYAGWTAATGGLHQEHTVKSWQLSEGEPDQ